MIDESKYSMDWDVFRDNADEAQKAFPIKDVLKLHFGLTPNENGRCPCPIHGGTNPNLAIYPESNTAHCYSDCDRSWDAITLVQSDLQNKGVDKGSYKAAFLTLCDEFGMDPLEFPGMRLRKGQTKPEPKPKKEKLEEAFIDPKGPDLKQHLGLNRNPFLPIVYRSEDNKVGTLRLTKSEAAYVVGVKLEEKAKQYVRLLNDMEETLHENLTDDFKVLLTPYDKILRDVQSMHPSPLPKDRKDAVDLVSMQKREFNRTALGQVFSHPIMDEMTDYSRYAGAIPLKSIQSTTPFVLPPLFNKAAERTIWREFLLPVPHENDVVRSPDGTKKAVPDLKKWERLAFDQVWAKKDHLALLSKVVEEEFGDFPETQEAVHLMQEKIKAKDRLCDQMLSVLGDLRGRLEKEPKQPKDTPSREEPESEPEYER